MMDDCADAMNGFVELDADDPDMQTVIGCALLIKGLSQVNQCSGISAAFIAVRVILEDLEKVDGRKLAEILRTYAEWAETDAKDEPALKDIAERRYDLTEEFFAIYDLKHGDVQGSA